MPTTYPAPVTYPLGPPTYAGPQLTVDTALQQPTRTTRRIADLTLQRFIVSAVFANGGSVQGGAVVYDMATLNELYLDRDVEYVAPGDEFPIVTSVRTAPQVAAVEKWGGKFFVTDEARDRNDVSGFNNKVTQLANTIVRKINTRAVAVMDAAITAQGGAGTFVGHSWSSVITGGSSQSNNNIWPAADFAAAQLLADTDELGVIYDLWLLNPAQAAQLGIVYGGALTALLEYYKITIFPSNRIPAGTAYVVATQQPGQMRIEKPLGTETWREGKNERTWMQSSVRPLWYIDQPYAIRKVTGLA